MASFKGTAGDDNISGTPGNDKFNLIQGGNDTASGGDGNDVFAMGATLNAGDHIDGGAGVDTVNLNGGYSAGLVFGLRRSPRARAMTSSRPARAHRDDRIAAATASTR